jgi:hypothetical protein
VYDILWVRILPEEQKVMRALCFFKRHAVRDDKAAESRRECLIIKISCTVRYFKHLLKTARKSRIAAVFFLLVDWRPTWAVTLC